ncbi:hypothetical protein DP42_2458 [Burkholderia pseudomallei]|nr:hypothetical protein DP42_2458 [Burkholderia pseudomallei]
MGGNRRGLDVPHRFCPESVPCLVIDLHGQHHEHHDSNGEQEQRLGNDRLLFCVDFGARIELEHLSRIRPLPFHRVFQATRVVAMIPLVEHRAFKPKQVTHVDMPPDQIAHRLTDSLRMLRDKDEVNALVTVHMQLLHIRRRLLAYRRRRIDALRLIDHDQSCASAFRATDATKVRQSRRARLPDLEYRRPARDAPSQFSSATKPHAASYRSPEPL